MKKHVVAAASRRVAVGLLSLSLASLLSRPVLANPAIANTPPCNSATVSFMTTTSGEARALAFVKALPGVGRIEKGQNGVYSASFGSAEAVNALIDDLNRNHAEDVIDLFQFFQCKYQM
jgi:hypothetical protein